jgi:hypothetical protein
MFLKSPAINPRWLNESQTRGIPDSGDLWQSCRTSDCAPIGQLLEGTGQGSGASSAIWLLFMITMLRALVNKISPGIQMTDPPRNYGVLSAPKSVHSALD